MGLYRFCILLAAASLLLVVSGGVVAGGVAPEQFHEILGSLVGLLTIGLLIWLWRVDRRPWLRWLGVGAFLLVALQGILGGLTLLSGLPASLSILHACAAQLFFALVAAIVLATSPSWQEGVALEASRRPPLRFLALATSAGVLTQVALGAAYRHGALGIMPHLIGAVVATGLVLLVSMIVLTQYGDCRPVARPAKRLLVITLHQVVLGVLAYFAGIINRGATLGGLLAPSLAVIHIVVGALMLAAVVILSIQIMRTVPAQVAAT